MGTDSSDPLLRAGQRAFCGGFSHLISPLLHKHKPNKYVEDCSLFSGFPGGVGSAGCRWRKYALKRLPAHKTPSNIYIKCDIGARLNAWGGVILKYCIAFYAINHINGYIFAQT